MILQSIHQNFGGMSDLLSQLPPQDYIQPSSSLSGGTIGEHTRHIIELFQCLLGQYNSGIVNYELRQRDYSIQTQIGSAQNALQDVLSQLDRPNKILELQQNLNGEILSIGTNYHRELLYNLEHCIHHQALIKVALLELTTLSVDENFGVASATIAYRKQCAQ